MEKIILDSPILDFAPNKDFIDVEDFEKTLIESIFSENFDSDVEEIKKINTRFIYDYYKVTLDNEDCYGIKISYINDYDVIGSEFKNLNLVNAKYPNLLSPEAIKFGSYTNCNYLIISYEFADNLEDLSFEVLSNNLDLFTSFIDAIHEVDASELSNLKEKLDFDASLIELESEMSKNDLIILQENYNLNFLDIKNIISKFREIIDKNYLEDQIVFSNFRIKKSTILFRDIFKCINFEDCYALDLHLSLKNVSTFLGFYFDQTLENSFLRSYLKMSNIVDTDPVSFINEYRSKEKLNKYIIFSDMFSRQLFHLLAIGHSNSEYLYYNFERYNHLRPEIKEILGDDISKVDNIFNVAFVNKE
jgi:hypothetical protein